MSYYSRAELEALGFRSIGREVMVSVLASIYNHAAIDIGDHSRIDDFCVISAGAGGISIGRRVHLAIYSSLLGAGRIEMRDYSGVSSRVSIYSSNDDYSGNTMSNPTVPAEFTGVTHAPVVVGEHVVIGAGSVVLPGVTLGRGASVGALSLVRSDCEELGMYFGSPARLIGRRSTTMFELQRELETREQRTESSSS